MAIKRKPAIREYECNQAERLTRHGEILERTSKILYGNGTPKDGLIFRFDQFMSDHGKVIADISEIKTTVNKAITESVNTQRLLEKYKSDEEQFEKGKSAIIELETIKKKSKRDDIRLAIQIITVIVVLLGAYIGAKEFYDKLTTQYDNLGTPVIINNRGEVGTLPNGDSLKYFRDGEFVNFDTVKK